MLTTLQSATNMSSQRIFRIGDGRCSSRLGHSVSLVNRSTEGNLEEIHDFNVDGSRTSHHQLNFSSEKGSDLVEHKHVITSAKIRGLSRICPKSSQLTSNSRINQPLFASSGIVHVILNLSINLVEKTRDRSKEGGFE
jgi:hypothetical protein